MEFAEVETTSGALHPLAMDGLRSGCDIKEMIGAKASGGSMTANSTSFVVVPAELFAVMVMVVVPAADAVPETIPSEKENPDGSPDTEMLASSSADSAKRYATPFTATYRS